MAVLKGCLRIFHFLHLGKKNPSVSIGGLGIPNIVIQFLYLLTINITCAGMIAYCILKVDDLFTLLGIGYSFIGLASIQSIYWSLIVNNSIVEASVDHLQEIVEKRKN